ncbi:hypothetical protein C1645_829057 [Glomus cerebriforme]|uniref:Uncharacterized protein n=1 Tax=Glomus cerebriforme TaxID=658196 RepID=A0A397SUL3_9GLOM|nr:hypothetical protein C1645_829057 [Glomus cerebriforme]
MTSKIDLLRQENARLMAENAEFKAKYDETKDEITKLRAELRNRIEELEKARIDTVAENTKCDVENVRHDAENSELKARVAKLKEDFRQSRKDFSPKKPADIPDPIVTNDAVPANFKSSEENMMDTFLDELNKKRVSNEIRQRRQEEKLAKVESIPEKDKQKVSKNDSNINCSNTISEPGLNSLDICLEQTVRSCDPLAVEMGISIFSILYEKLCNAKDFADLNPESNAVSKILNMEIRAQLLADTSDALLWKRIEQDIQYIIDNMPVDYSIKIESSACVLSKDGLPSDEKNPELSHPDLGSGSDKNSELSHTSNTSEE